MKIRDLLFPYRSHLETEVEWLKHQLAQEKRRVDALTERISPTSPTASPAILPALTNTKPRTNVRPQPIGWDAYREFQRQQEQEEEKKDGIHS